MEIKVEVGGWEHECCGPNYEIDTIVTMNCLVLDADETRTRRYVESHHDLGTTAETAEVRGRVADIRMEHLDGTSEAIKRLPSGMALRGFDADDDGHLEQPLTGQHITNNSNQFLLTVDS